MNPNITFKEKSKIVKEILSKQSPVTLEEAKAQVALLKKQRNKVSSSYKNVPFHS